MRTDRHEQAGETGETGVTPPSPTAAVAETLEQARRALARGERAQARLLLEAVAAAEPENEAARELLARMEEKGEARTAERFHHDPIRGFTPASPPRLSPGYLWDAFAAWFRTEGLLPACILATALILLLILYVTGALGRG